MIDTTLFVKFYAVSEHTHYVMLNDGTVWASWAGLPWTNQGMPPRCPFQNETAGREGGA